MKISETIKYVGVNDHKIDLFEGQFKVPKGMAYNSYLILDEKLAVMDSVEENFGDEWISNIKRFAGDKKIDYLVVHHMEMDHSANILKFMSEYPDAKIVASKMAFMIMKNMFGTDFSEKQIVVAEGTTLNLGRHTLNFITAPLVHWPEVMMSYESSEKVLFSADAFGKFGANDGSNGDSTDDAIDDGAKIENWLDEARRYYIGIVGKFGTNVQDVLKKISSLDIKSICSLHGPVLKENLGQYINLYKLWSSYTSEEDGIFIAYTSVYGHTKKAAQKIAEILKEKGKKVAIADLARTDMSENVANAFKYKRMILATTTYTGEIFPIMDEFIHQISERNFQNRKIGIIENGSWYPTAAKVMSEKLEKLKDISFCATKVSIKISLTDDNILQLKKLAEEISE